MYVVYVIIIYCIHVTDVQVRKHTNNPNHKVFQNVLVIGTSWLNVSSEGSESVFLLSILFPFQELSLQLQCLPIKKQLDSVLKVVILRQIVS